MQQNDSLISNFILNTTWNDFPRLIQLQAQKCAIDLLGALIAGSQAKTTHIMAGFAAANFGGSAATMLIDGSKSSCAGAALVNGFAINAYDIDDGHKIVKGHPGAAVFPALLAAAEFRDISLRDLLTSLVIAYEIAIRAGLALHEHYNYYHGSGSWGAIGAAAGVSRLLGLDGEQTRHALGSAEYYAPLAPVMRPVAVPSMNKDGIGWGNMVGISAALLAEQGNTGSPSILDYDRFAHLTSSLGRQYKIMDLYFKPYACCRWAHPSVSAALELQQKHNIKPEDISSITIYTFSAAASLFQNQPTNSEEAQYNVKYPVAAAVCAGEVGPRQVSAEFSARHDVIALMAKTRINVDSELDREFPGQRLCRVEIALKDKKVLKSGIHSPPGEPENPVSMDWIEDKFFWLTADLLNKNTARRLVDMLQGDLSMYAARELINLIAPSRQE